MDPSVRRPDRPIPRFIRDYELLSPLGQGGMGMVYQALHTRMKRTVALKLLTPDRMHSREAITRFEREMRAVGALDHPHIVRAYDAGEADGLHFLVMELVVGLDLASLLSRVGRLPVPDACEVVRQAALGLQHAHEHGMVHRDIKPSNLMLTRSGQVKILDLGLALLAAGDPHPGELTGSQQVMGTLDYMAPEQCLDTHAVDIRADIYSLGATLYKLLTGTAPFSGERVLGPMQKMLALTTREAPPVTTYCEAVSPELLAVVDLLLARDPSQRFATPQEVAQALAPFAHGADLVALFLAASSLPPPAPTSGATDMPHGSGVESALDSTPSSQDETSTLTGPVRLPYVSPGGGPHNAGRAPQELSRRRTRRIVSVTAALTLLVLAIAAWSMLTPRGDVRIVVPADVAEDLQVRLLRNGTTRVVDATDGWSVQLAEGDYQIELQGGSDRFEADRQSVAVLSSQTAVVTVRPKAIARQRTFGKRVAGLLGKLPQFMSTRQSKADEADRKLAEWVLSFPGAAVSISGGKSAISSADELPQSPFSLIRVDFRNSEVQQRPRSLTDADVERFRDVVKLEELVLRDWQISDSGWQRLADFSGLCESLKLLAVLGDSLTDDELGHFKSFLALQTLELDSPAITDSGLSRLQELKNLKVLLLPNTMVSDIGLEQLLPLTELERLDLSHTQITAAGVAALQLALPNCQIQHTAE